MRLATGSTGACTGAPLTTGAECYTTNHRGVSPSIAPAIADQVGYVVRTIQNINGFFATYSSSKFQHGPAPNI